jgi:hypothetical protein
MRNVYSSLYLDHPLNEHQIKQMKTVGYLVDAEIQYAEA